MRCSRLCCMNSFTWCIFKIDFFPLSFCLCFFYVLQRTPPVAFQNKLWERFRCAHWSCWSSFTNTHLQTNFHTIPPKGWSVFDKELKVSGEIMKIFCVYLIFLFYLSQLNVQDNAVFFATYAGLKYLRKALQLPGLSKSDLSDQSGV